MVFFYGGPVFPVVEWRQVIVACELSWYLIVSFVNK